MIPRSSALLALAALTAGLALALSGGGEVASASARTAPPQGRHDLYDLLTAQNSALLLVDHQAQRLARVRSHDPAAVRAAVEALAKAATVFGVPAVLTTLAAPAGSDPLLPELRALFPVGEIHERTSLNAWDDASVKRALAESGRKKLVLAGLWTEGSVAMPALEALRAGYDVYVVTDASGGTSAEAHEMAVLRLLQAGAIPVTWQQVMLEWQRDWAREETAGAVAEIAREHDSAAAEGRPSGGR